MRNLCWEYHFRANFGALSLGFDVKALLSQGLTGSPNYFGPLDNLMTLIICESLREIGEMACVTPAWSSRGQTLNLIRSRWSYSGNYRSIPWIKLYCTFTVMAILYKSIIALAAVGSICIFALRVGNSMTWVDLCSTLVDIWHKRIWYEFRRACQTNTVPRASILVTREIPIEGLSD